MASTRLRYNGRSPLSWPTACRLPDCSLAMVCASALSPSRPLTWCLMSVLRLLWARCSTRRATKVQSLSPSARSNLAWPVSVKVVPGASVRTVPAPTWVSRVTSSACNCWSAMQALEVTRETHVGAGTVRTLAPGTTFTLTDQARLDLADGDSDCTFVALRVLHLAHNNLSTDIKHQVSGLLGLSALAQTIAKEQSGSLHAVGQDKG